jgi:hypothetical protein
MTEAGMQPYRRDQHRTAALGRRYRVALFLVACCAWAGLIREAHLRLERGSQGPRGARKVLDIGALPVT